MVIFSKLTEYSNTTYVVGTPIYKKYIKIINTYVTLENSFYFKKELTEIVSYVVILFSKFIWNKIKWYINI